MLPDTELPGCDAAAGDVSSQLHGLRAQLTAVGAGVESLAGELHGELRTILKRDSHLGPPRDARRTVDPVGAGPDT